LSTKTRFIENYQLFLDHPVYSAQCTQTFFYFEKLSKDYAKLLIEAAGTACWDVANIWFGKQEQRCLLTVLLVIYAIFYGEIITDETDDEMSVSWSNSDGY
jgi:hypothetical protein